MKNLIATSLRYISGELQVLDQRRLPLEEHWHHCRDEHDLVDLIRGLAIRGAPLIVFPRHCGSVMPRSAATAYNNCYRQLGCCVHRGRPR